MSFFVSLRFSLNLRCLSDTLKYSNKYCYCSISTDLYTDQSLIAQWGNNWFASFNDRISKQVLFLYRFWRPGFSSVNTEAYHSNEAPSFEYLIGPSLLNTWTWAQMYIKNHCSRFWKICCSVLWLQEVLNSFFLQESD